MSVENLRIDPAFDAIREAPEFKALLAEAPTAAPAQGSPK
jgi:hypothetical protein